MSPRTLIVGVLAAVCGICATAGVLTWNRAKPTDKQSIVTARVGISLGSKVEPQMLKLEEWYSSQVPAGAFTTLEEVVGKYCTAPIFAGQTILSGQLDTAPTSLQPEPGFFAVAIGTETESSNLGKNLVAGNRVDVIWVMTEAHEALGGPFSKRLLENVRVLAVGQNSTSQPGTDTRRELKSVTLEVKAKMDENLVLAQELGTLSLSMRNPNDQTAVEPTLLTNIGDLLKDAVNAREAAKSAPANAAVDQVKSMIEDVVGQVTALAQKVDRLTNPAGTSTSLSDESRNRIPAGMIGRTIETKSEATGVAGLLLPGHRVDLFVTWNQEVFDLFNPLARERESRSIVLLENVEVLAVDTQLMVRDDNQDKKMSRSVTLIVTQEMGRQISQAEQMGTLTLGLRSVEDSKTAEPRQVVNLDQYLGSNMAQSQYAMVDSGNKNVQHSIVPVRLNRGGVNQDQMFMVGPGDANPN